MFFFRMVCLVLSVSAGTGLCCGCVGPVVTGQIRIRTLIRTGRDGSSSDPHIIVDAEPRISLTEYVCRICALGAMFIFIFWIYMEIESDEIGGRNVNFNEISQLGVRIRISLCLIFVFWVSCVCGANKYPNGVRRGFNETLFETPRLRSQTRAFLP